MTAPTLLEYTSLAYLASTPLVYLGGSGCQLGNWTKIFIYIGIRFDSL
ncbi:hypothetical protein [Dolichospermum sp. LEGE 00246]|nr:hypothetical protein [Dolichospermum sp. LEGE 00246]